MGTGGAVVQTGRSRTDSATYTGASGADTFIMINTADTITGGSGTDTLDINKAAILGGLNIDLTNTTDQVISFNGSSSTGTVLGFENVLADGYTGTFGAQLVGTSTANTLTGTTNGDVINGAAGNDTITGGAGADTLTGGSGTDTITGGAGADIIDGGAGADDIVFSADGDLGIAGTLAQAQGDTVTFVLADDAISLIGDFLTGSLTTTVANAVNAIANTGGIDLNGTGTGDDTVSLIAGNANNTAVLSDLFDITDLAAALGTITNEATNDERMLAFTAASGETALYKYTAGDAGDDLDAGELQLLAVFDTTLTAADFTFS
jgi:hypothetical protein